MDEAEALIRRALPQSSLDSFASFVRVAADTSPQDAAAANGAHPLVEVRALKFNYPDGPPVLDSIDLRIAPGEFVAIIGQNGSGKTTLAKHLVGLLRPTAGAVMLNGRDRTTMRPAETAAEVGYVFQNPDHQIFAATVEDEVAFGPRNFDLAPGEIQRRCDEVLRAVGLQDARALDPFLLSKGERQRLAVASVLALRPRLLILDEPTTGLDYREQRRMMALVTELNRDGIAIVMITHTPWLVAEYARRVVLIRSGRKLFDGGVREFFGQRRAARVLVVSRARGDRAFAPLRHGRAGARRTRRVACGSSADAHFSLHRARHLHPSAASDGQGFCAVRDVLVGLLGRPSAGPAAARVGDAGARANSPARGRTSIACAGSSSW